MDQIREGLDRISELSDEELKSLEDSVVAEFETVESQDPTREIVQAMTDLADAADAIRGEKEARVQEAAELAQQAAEASARMTAGTEEVDESVEGEAPAAEEETPEEAEASAEPVAEEEAPAEPAAEEPAAPVAEEEAPAEPAAEDEAAADVPNTDEDAADGGVDDVKEDTSLTPEEKKKLEGFSAETEEAAVATLAESATSELAADEAAPAAESELSAETAGEPTPTPEAELASEEPTTELSEEPVTASASTEGLEFQAPASAAPAIPAITASVAITAGADIPGVTAGTQLPNLTAVAQAIIDRRKGMGRTSGGDGEQHTVAVFTTSFPESRTLSSNDIEGNRNKIDGVVSPEAIVAAGGSAAPVEVRYELYGLGDADRPVKDSLAVFGADRGGIRYVTPPVLTDLNGAVSLWTLADDVAAASGSTPVKPSLRVAAGAEVVVYTDAIPLILTFGNMGARAYPELVERHTQLGMIQHARFAETRLLTRIGAMSTAVSAAKELGAARDIFVQVDTAAAAYRNRHRVAANTPLRVIFPEWFKAALRADLTKQLPGNGNEDTFELADAKINQWFSVRNINVTWSLDGETGQILGAQAGSGVALNSFPSTVIWYLFSEGTFLFLDGGTLDLGLVRDSTLNATNDYKIFLETFEGVAKVGIESLRVTSQLAIAGASVGTVTPVI